MSDIIKGKKLSDSDTIKFNELRNSSSADRAFIPGIVKDEANVKIPIGSFVSDSWKQWSENHNSTSEYPDIASAIYIGPNNEISGSGHAYVVGENNKVVATTNEMSDSRGGSYVFGMDNYVNDGFVIGNQVTALEGSKVFGRDVSANNCSTVIGYNASAANGSLILSTPSVNSFKKIATDGSLILSMGYRSNTSAIAKDGSILIGSENNRATGGSVLIGKHNTAELGSLVIGINSSGSLGSTVIGSNASADGGIAIGKYGENSNGNTYAAPGGIAIGNYASAINGALSVSIDDKSVYSYAGAIAIGMNCSAYGGSIAMNCGSSDSNNEANANLGGIIIRAGSTCPSSACFGGVVLGDGGSAAYGAGVIGSENNARYGSYAFGVKNNVSYGSFSFGFRNIIERSATNFGEDNSAYNSIVFGKNNETRCEPYLIKKSLAESAVSAWDDGGVHPNISKTTFGLNYILPTKNVLIGFNNSAKNTRNAYLIGNNNYTETTIEDLELDCDPNSTATKGQDNDGFTLAFGLANSAIRNYDIAIGKETLASGGENIVIGTPYTALNNIQYHIPREDDDENFINVTSYLPAKYIPTKSIGYKNLNIRSNIDGISNIAFESILSGFELSSYNSNNTNIGAIHNTLIQSEVNIKNITGTGNLFVRNKFYNCSNGSFDNISGSIVVDANNESINFIDNNFDKTNLISITNNGSSLMFDYNNFNGCAGIKINANNFHNNNIIGGCNTTTITFSGDQVSDNYLFNSVGAANCNLDLICNNITSNTFKNLNCNKKIISKYGIHFNEIVNTRLEGNTNINTQDFLSNIIKNSVLNKNISAREINYNIIYGTNLQNDIILKNGYLVRNILTNNESTDSLSNYNYITDNIINNNRLIVLGPVTEENEITNATFTNNILLNNNCSANRKNEFDAQLISFSGISHASFNIITNSRVSAYLNEENEPEETVFNDNLILNSIVNCELFGANDASAANFTNNYAFNSYIESNYENKNKSEAFKNNPVQNNVIFNYSALNTNGSLAFCDGFGGGTNNVSPILSNCNAVISLGQNQIEDSVETSVYGYDNKIVSAERLYILGQHNNISADVNRDNLIAGSNNNISGDIADTIDRNTILGNGNTLSGQFVDCNILGDCNELNNETQTVFENDTLIGLHNKVEFGSNSTLIGQHNIANGYNGIAIGEGLSTTNSQVVVGRFNEVLPGTDDRTGQDVTSGALFIVGNGSHTGDDFDNPTRSNAMVVSADGTVSAKTYKADPNSKLGKLFEFLNDSTISTTGKLTWDGNIWSFAQ